MKWALAIRRYRCPEGVRYEADFMTKNGVEPLPQLITFKEVTKWLLEKKGIRLIKAKHLIWERAKLPAGYRGRSAEYAFVDATQPNPHGSVVTLTEKINGWKPNWDER